MSKRRTEARGGSKIRGEKAIFEGRKGEVYVVKQARSKSGRREFLLRKKTARS